MFHFLLDDIADHVLVRLSWDKILQAGIEHNRVLFLLNRHPQNHVHGLAAGQFISRFRVNPKHSQPRHSLSVQTIESIRRKATQLPVLLAQLLFHLPKDLDVATLPLSQLNEEPAGLAIVANRRRSAVKCRPVSLDLFGDLENLMPGQFYIHLVPLHKRSDHPPNFASVGDWLTILTGGGGPTCTKAKEHPSSVTQTNCIYQGGLALFANLAWAATREVRPLRRAQRQAAKPFPSISRTGPPPPRAVRGLFRKNPDLTAGDECAYLLQWCQDMDEIRRKLDLIDEQLARQNATGRLIRTAPLFFCAAGLMAGILLQAKLPMTRTEGCPWAWARVWMILLGLCAGGTCVYFIHNRRHPRPGVLACGAAFCFLCLGAVRLIAFTTPAGDDVRHLVGAERRLATIAGCIVTEPRIEQREWAFARFSHADPSTSFYLTLGQVKTGAGWRHTRGTIRVLVGEPAPSLRIGDSIQAFCWLHRFEDPTNPGQFNVAEYLRHRNVWVGASVASRNAISIRRESPPAVLTRLRKILGRAAARALLDHAPSDTPSEGLLEALLLGYRGNIDRRTYEAFRKTGLLHLISLSGMHLGILAGLLWWLGKTLGLLKPARALVCMAATVIFLLVVPPRPPTIRAAVIVLVCCLSILLRRRANPLNSLSLAAMVLLLLRPMNLFEAGWQLSFAAVAGILSLTGGIERFIRDRITSRLPTFGRLPRPVTRVVQGIGNAAIRLLAAGWAAWLGGAGILLYHFYTITPLASVWTVLVFPFVAAILILGFVKVVLFFLLPTLSTVLGSVACVLADVLIEIVRLIAKLDFSQVLMGHVTLGPIVLYYALVFLAAFVHIRRPALKKAACAVLALTLFLSLGLIKWQRTQRNHLSLTCLDVGHGQAILARLPGSTNILFDAGSLYKADIPEIAGGRRIEHVYAADPFLAPTKTEGAARFLADWLREKALAMEPVPETLTIGPTKITTLWPVPDMALDPELGDNNRSLVTLIELAGVKILLCSDIEQSTQQQILRLYRGLEADVVVVPHHGSTATLRPGFLQELDPKVLLCSCGKKEQAHRLGSVKDVNASLWCTATNGAVTICVDKAGVVETTTHLIEEGD